ncbi:hypothetical protein ACIA74_37490 [Streptomyces sp. NPDC051658]|uniref:hypothetical protein n=1 Tax=unclassified Streptomyces TaxID=2593676 RepID=UPI0037AD1CCD|nr:hypothetical protein OG520_00815 [Streptomyces sp. NBC_00984]
MSTAALGLRSETDIQMSLQDTNFQVQQIYGGWNREPLGSEEGEFLVVAHTC